MKCKSDIIMDLVGATYHVARYIYAASGRLASRPSISVDLCDIRHIIGSGAIALDFAERACQDKNKSVTLQIHVLALLIARKNGAQTYV